MNGIMRIMKGFEFRELDSPIHRLDPRVKLLYSCCMLVLSLLFVNIFVLMLILTTSIPLVLLGRVIKRWLNMIRGLIPLLVFIFVVNFLFSPNINGLEYATSMTLRFLALSSTFSVVFLTTSPESLAMALIKMKVPYEFTLAFTMAVRFLPTLARDLQRIIDAQRARGLELEKGGFLKRVKNFIPILVPLMVYEIRRSFQIAEAMESRGFGLPKKRTFLYEAKFSKTDYIVTLIILTLVAIMVLLKIIWNIS